MIIEPHELQQIKDQIERDGSPVIYLHVGPDQPSFAMLVVDQDMREAAEKGMESEGWKWFEHSHIDGDDE